MTFETLTVQGAMLLEEHGETHFEHMLSASQIETWRDCERKWAYNYIERKPRGNNPYAAVGTAMHDVAEKFLVDGSLPPPDKILVTTEHKGVKRDWTGAEITKIFMAGVKHLPAPGVAKVEGYFELDTMVGVIRGYKDFTFEVPRGGGCRDVVVGDHKTTSGIKWAKTADDLQTDTQAVIYAADEAEKRDLNDHDVVKLRWVYYLRDAKKPRSKLVETKLTCRSIDKAILPILETGLEIQRAYYGQKPAAEHTPNAQSCNKYGGCDFKGFCPVTNQEKMRSFMTQSSLKEKMAARAKAKEAKKPAPAATEVAPKATPAKSAPVFSRADDVAKVNPPAIAQPMAYPPVVLTFAFETPAEAQAFLGRLA